MPADGRRRTVTYVDGDGDGAAATEGH